MVLRGVKPVAEEKRLKMLVYGPSGVGKTTAAIQFENAYILDCEKGTDFYSSTINKAGSAVFKTNNCDEIMDELKTLLTTKHPYKTLVIDPITQVYNACQEKWTLIFEKYSKTTKEAEIQDFGPRFWGRVKSEMKTIDRLLAALDMNVIVLSHQKDIYGPGMTKLGVGPDAMKGAEYLFDLVFELRNVGGKRMAVTVKERAEIGQPKFPAEFEWSFQNFLKFYGEEVIRREAKPIALATAEEAVQLRKLLEIVRIPEETVTSWLTKAQVDKFEDMRGDQIAGCIKYCEKKLADLKLNGKEAV